MRNKKNYLLLTCIFITIYFSPSIFSIPLLYPQAVYYNTMFFTADGQQSQAMNKIVGKFGLDFFGFRSLAGPVYSSPRICASTVSYSAEATNPQNLPKLPVPPLSQTLEKYLRSVKPFLNNAELQNTTDLVNKFGAGVGQKLQVLLEKRAKTRENWLAEWWLQTSYLDYRWPLAMYSNPGLVFPFQKFSNESEQLRYAAKMILASLDYKKLIDTNTLPVDKMGKEPLDMGQYKRVFGTYRIPGVKRDSLSFHNSKFIAVLHNGHAFACPLWGEDNVLLSEAQIVNQLKKIILQSQQTASHPIGILTSEHRDTWGRVYKDLSQDETNKASLKVLEQSLFVLCLDKGTCLGDERWEKQTIAAGETIHGNGSKNNSGNRWFDKTLQLIVSPNGMNGLTYEHCTAEGQPIAVLMDHVIDYIMNNKSSENTSSISVKDIKKLEFNTTPDIEDSINKAKQNIDKMVAELDLHCFTFDIYGKDFIKSHKLSPDSFLQMAFQFTFYRLHKVPAAHYESAATRKFIGGRTETIRSCSLESVNFAKTMLDTKASIKDKVAALKTAVISHKDYSLQAVNGLGVDRHLLGLKLIAIENGIEIPAIYSDPAFARSTDMRLSTSQVAARCDSFMCYAPLTPNGYATCYNPRDKDIYFATSVFKSNPETDVRQYRRALEESLMDMHNTLLLGTQSKL